MSSLLQLILGGLSVGSIYGLVALSYNVIFNTTTVINFSAGELVTTGALCGFSFYAIWHIPIILSILLSAAVVAFLALLVERIAIRPVKDVSRNFIWIMSTFGFGVALKHTAILIWGSAPLPFPKFIGGDNSVSIFGALVLPQELGIILITFLCTGLLEIYYRKTIFGTAVRATSLDRETAGIMGINTKHVIYFSFAISGVLAAICGIMVSPVTFADPNMGIVLGVKGFVAAVMGGLGSAIGGVLGGILLGLIEVFSSTVVPPIWQEAVVFVVLILAILIRPSGLFGKRME